MSSEDVIAIPRRIVKRAVYLLRGYPTSRRSETKDEMMIDELADLRKAPSIEDAEMRARLWRELDAEHREIAALLRATASALRRGDDEKSDPPGIRPWHAAARLDKIAAQIAGAASSQQRAKRKG